jgi:hypothetical protein
MDERDVAELLRSLPRARAGEGFTDAVRERIRGGSPRRHLGKRGDPRRDRRRIVLPALVAAGAFAVVAGLRLDALRRDREIRRETRALAREIEEMKRTLPSPLVEVSGENGARYVVDLRRLPGRRDGVL